MHQTDRPHRWLDDLVLDVVRDDPATMVRVFMRLCTANPGDRVLAFLDEDTSLREELAMFRTMPAAPFQRALGQRLRRRSAGYPAP